MRIHILQSFWPLICPPFDSLLPFRKLLQLLKKVGSDFKILPSWINEFECFEEAPLKLEHEVDDSNNTWSTLSSLRQQKHTRSSIIGFIYKFYNFKRHLIMVIKYQLSVIINPVEGEEFKAKSRDLWVVVYFLSGTVDYVSNLVGNYKIYILTRICVSEVYPITETNCPNRPLIYDMLL